MIETHEFKKVPIHSNATVVICSKLPRQRGTSLVNNSRQQGIAPKAKPRTAWRVLCQVRVRIVYAHANFLPAKFYVAELDQHTRWPRRLRTFGRPPYNSAHCRDHESVKV